MILFGLFHGLVLLPVLLSLVGSRPHPTKESVQEELDDKELKEITTKLTEDINVPT